MMKDGQVWGRAGIAIVTALIMCMMGAGAYAISPEQYRSALEENVEQVAIRAIGARWRASYARTKQACATARVCSR